MRHKTAAKNVQPLAPTEHSLPLLQCIAVFSLSPTTRKSQKNSNLQNRVFAAEGVLKSKNGRKQISLKIKFPIQFQLCES